MAIALLGSAIAASTNQTSVTTGNINSTGATLLVAVVANYNPAPTAAMLADQGVGGTNTWTALTDNADTVYPLHARIIYAVNPTKTGASHGLTFNPASGATYPCVAFYAFSGTATSSVFDAESGNNSGASSALTSLQATATVTPAGAGEVLVTGLTSNYSGTPTCDEGFAGNEIRVTSSANNIALSASYQIQSPGPTGRRPTWSWSPSGYPADMAVAAFKAPAASGRLFTDSILSGIGAGGPFFQNPLN